MIEPDSPLCFGEGVVAGTNYSTVCSPPYDVNPVSTDRAIPLPVSVEA